jgi:hypothetical protein
VHDFDLRYPDGRISGVEVTASVDRVRQETHAAILDARRGGCAIKRRLSNKHWYITPLVGTRIDKIRDKGKGDEYLAAIEAAGLESFHYPIADDPSVERICTELGVVSGIVFPWKEPGYITIALPGGGGAIGPILVIDAVRREVFKDDNRAKLAAANTTERHLAVYIDLGNYRPWCALVDREPPAVLPKLPLEITDVWAFSETRSDGQYVVWRASSTTPWHSLGRVAPPAERLVLTRVPDALPKKNQDPTGRRGVVRRSPARPRCCQAGVKKTAEICPAPGRATVKAAWAPFIVGQT